MSHFTCTRDSTGDVAISLFPKTAGVCGHFISPRTARVASPCYVSPHTGVRDLWFPRTQSTFPEIVPVLQLYCRVFVPCNAHTVLLLADSADVYPLLAGTLCWGNQSR